MGAYLSAAVPPITFPVERYVSDLADMEFQCNLGSTRFMKVARVLHREGQCVVKVFVVNDPSLPLSLYKNAIERIYEKLKDSPNCLPFSKVMQSSKASFLIRQYISYSLYDRLSTRPFLTDVEKRWIAYQLLKALEQCHDNDICHGDIKTENVLITSSAWTLLSDFANFKPSTIPYDNPADFTYFFDSSRRRTCYIAPERFTVSSDMTELDLMPEGAGGRQSKFALKHEMDIFSLGCVLLELFCDNASPFDLSQLLAYRQGMYHPTKALDGLSCPHLRDMIEKMIHLNPLERPSAAQCLKLYRETVFPSIFYDFLWQYLKSYVDLPLMSDDEKVEKLSNDMERVFEMFKSSDNSVDPSILTVLSLATSLTRSVRTCDAKWRLLEILTRFASLVDADVVLDRILPFMLYFVGDDVARIRALSIHTITKVMANVKTVPASDARVFVDYIFPTVLPRINDNSGVVKLALASCIGCLAVTAKSFLEQADVTLEKDPHVMACQELNSEVDHQKELNILDDLVQDVTVTLLCDPNLYVRKVLVQDSLELLCRFFGDRKSSDVLLSHIVTFLNEKNDWRLRYLFFQCCPKLTISIGAQSWCVLFPLYQQGLRDCEENVIFATFQSLFELSKLGLVERTIAFDLLNDIVPFLRHPNLMLRIGAVSFICSTAKALRLCDVHCKLMPKIEPYVKQPFFSIDREECLLWALKEPVPKSIWDVVVGSPYLPELLSCFRERHLIRSLGNVKDRGSGDEFLPLTPDDPKLAKLYFKLRRQGFTDEHEDVFVSFATNLLRVRAIRENSRMMSTSEEDDERSYLDFGGNNARTHTVDLTVGMGRQVAFSGDDLSRADGGVLNVEWLQMFGSDSSQNNEAAYVMSSKNEEEVVEATVERTKRVSSSMETPSLSASNLSTASSSGAAKSAELLPRQFEHYFEPNTVLVVDTTCASEARPLYSPCKAELDAFVEWQRDLWAQNASRLLSTTAEDKTAPTAAWKPSGTLLADLHEHSGAVHRLAVHSNGRFFASVGSDGCLKIWDIKSMIGRSMSNRSACSFKEFASKATGVDIADNFIVCSSSDGSVKFFKMDLAGARNPSKFSSNSYALRDDYLIDFYSSFKGSHLVVVGLSHHGNVCCFDSRMSSPAWSYPNPYEKGLVTCLCVDQSVNKWALVGTETGYFVLWDLRFQLNVREFKHPANIPILRLRPVLGPSSRVLATFVKQGEVSEWDLESGIRHYAIWPSDLPPLSYHDRSSENVENRPIAVTSLSQFGGDASSPGVVLTGDDSGRIRYWNLANLSDSFILSSFAPAPTDLTYKYKIVDGTHVVYCTSLHSEDLQMASKEQTEIRVSSAHHELITDMKLCHFDDWLLISSSRDGVIKLWK
ncbi:Phosphoinositide 3-kinase regulatory subunit 4 [Trichuris trichiura]|uniref:non-specific serine/threonine protein kinase n=1 Tax=Trichuris trichiura TaxID=36087 RepID=A0A077YYZ9_TRITR|nr:Phosphoinositide 3-kinase regulatory subunit 4 [Trichuris trichiura]